MGALRVRLATVADAASIVAMIHAHAEDEDSRHLCRTTAEDIRREGFGPRPLFEVLVAERRATVLGMAMFLEVFSSWEGRPILFLEDLYVTPAARRGGAGRALLARLARLARERGCPRIDWLVTDDNPAREFYHRLGAEHLADWHFYRLRGVALDRLAER